MYVEDWRWNSKGKPGKGNDETLLLSGVTVAVAPWRCASGAFFFNWCLGKRVWEGESTWLAVGSCTAGCMAGCLLAARLVSLQLRAGVDEVPKWFPVDRSSAAVLPWTLSVCVLLPVWGCRSWWASLKGAGKLCRRLRRAVWSSAWKVLTPVIKAGFDYQGKKPAKLGYLGLGWPT